MSNKFIEMNALEQQDSGIYSHPSSSVFSYSDGDASETYLYEVIRDVGDVSSLSVELEEYIRDWSSKYHLTSSRSNLLRGFTFAEGDRALELGAGCGSITRYLGECGLEVDAVEGSRRRAEIARERCRDLDNVIVVQSNFNQLDFPENSYDYVFLIGVLEYAGRFLDGASDEEAFTKILSRAREALRPDGVIFAAIENRMGLKYWLGANEDHYGRPFIGLYDYPRARGIRTYDKKSLQHLFSSLKLNYFRFLYPFPDYKLPRLLLSDEFVRTDPHASSLLYRLSSQDYQSSMHAECSEFLLWNALQKNKYLEEFANSFLVVLGKNKEVVDRLVEHDFIYYSGTDRRPSYRTITCKPAGEPRVIKTSLASNLTESVRAQGHDLDEAEYISGPLLSICWLQSFVADPAGEEFLQYVDNYWKFLRGTAGPDGSDLNNFDLLPFNIIVDEQGRYVVIDEEWKSEQAVSAEFVLFRALLFYSIENSPLFKPFNESIGAQTTYDFIDWFFKRYDLDLENQLDSFIRLQTDLVRNIVSNAVPEQDLLNALYQPFTYLQRISLPEVETVELYWSDDRDSFKEQNKLSCRVGHTDGSVVCRFRLPESSEKLRYLRLDPGDRPGFFSLRNISLYSIFPDGNREIACEFSGADTIIGKSYLHNINFLAGEMGNIFVALNNDPYLVIDLARMKCTVPLPGAKLQVEVAMSLPESADFFLARQALYQAADWYDCQVLKLRNRIKEQRKRAEEQKIVLAKKSNSIDLYHEELMKYQARLQALQGSYDLLVNSPAARAKARLRVIWRLREKLKQYINALRYQFNSDYKIINRSGLFDRNYYLTRYPDVAEAGVDPLVHYLDVGWQEQRDPNPLFCTAFYIGRNPDVAEGGINPLFHYLQTGAVKQRDPCPVFHTNYYVKQLLAPLPSSLTPLGHYLKYGADGKADPNPLFDSRYYLKNNPDVASAGINPLVHYQLSGGAELRDPSPFFSTEYYVNKYPELKQSEITVLDHYCRRVIESGGRDGLFFNQLPKISILTPVYNVAATYLKNCVTSVLQQSYPNWELCLVDDGSSADHIRPLLEEFATRDSRIKIKILAKNQGIAGATNEAVALATGEYLTFLDNDDELAVNALMEVAKAIENHGADLYYSDEDIIDFDGHATGTHCKPDYSPDLLLSHNYITHLLVVRRSLFDRAGGLETAHDGAQDFDMVLRLTELTEKIVHIPKVLYHWRSIETSTAADPEAKGYAGEAGKKALEKALQRRKIDGKVLSGNKKFYYRVQRKISGEPPVSIIIPFRDQPDYLRRCIDSLLNRTGYQNFEIIGVDNKSEKQETADLLQKLDAADSRIRFIRYEKPFNYSAINNFAVRQAGGEHIILMNNDIEVLNVDWLESLLEHSQRPEVGAVGAKLYYKNNTIQHAGVIVGIAGFAGHSHRHFPRRSPGYFNRLYCIQNLSAVTAALLMVKKNYFLEVGGLDEENLGTALNDVDFCLKLREKGYLNVFTPYCEAYHYESVSRGYEDTPEKQKRFRREVSFFQQRWAKVLAAGDPYYNPQLTLEREDFSLKVE
jgi:GT2 family glycosyltransferase/2-polyprenyl-3-methyl-5-hydroxy-6-metoxy-1,4-benzoquinol methylase